MLNISIDKENTVVHNTKTYGKWTVKTSCFFGVVYAALERDFPNFDCSEMGNIIVNRINNEFKRLNNQPEAKQEKSAYLFHCEEYGVSLYNLLMFIDGQKVLSPTLKDIEDLRMVHRMTTSYLPVSIDKPGSMRFEGLKTVTQVMIAALYYYAYNEYKLTRCKHCGKWFATKTLKEEYCDNTSPCYGLIVAGKKVLGSKRTCKDAVGIIKQRLADRKKQIYDKWYAEGLEEECFELNERFYQYKAAIKENPTVENITACMEYLYSDSMPKQERPNRRKSNAYMRGLLGT